MKTPDPTTLVLVGIALLLPLTGGCQSVKDLYASAVLKGATLSYPQYLAVQDEGAGRPTVDELLEQFGEPAGVFTRKGKRRKVIYNAFSLNEELRKAEFYFDEDEVLMKKQIW